jgi:hypothetical protein
MSKITIDDVLYVERNLKQNIEALERQVALLKLNLKHMAAEVHERKQKGEKPTEKKEVLKEKNE